MVDFNPFTFLIKRHNPYEPMYLLEYSSFAVARQNMQLACHLIDCLVYTLFRTDVSERE